MALIKIAKALEGLPKVKLNLMIPLQGKLKNLTTENSVKLFNQIKKEFKFPFFIWIPVKDEEVIVDGEKRKISKGDHIVNDGTQRYTVLMAHNCGEQEFPYVLIEAKNFKQYKLNLAAVASQYGKITMDGYESFVFDLNDGEKEQFELKPIEFNFAEPKQSKERTVKSTVVDTEIYLNVKCKTKEIADELFERLKGEGYECKVTT